MTLAPLARPTLAVERSTGLDALVALDRLDGLWARTSTPVTGRAAWLRAAAEADPRWTPLLLVVARDGEPVAAAPLAVRTERGVRTVRMLDLGHADHARLPADDDLAAAALGRALLAELRSGGAWRLDLQQLPPDDAVIGWLGSALALRVEPGAGCPLAVVDPAVPLPSQLSANGRKSLRGGRNRLAADGRVLTVQWLRGPSVLTELPALQELRRDRDHAVGRASEMDDPAGRAFHTGLVQALVARDEVELLMMHVDGVLAAFDLMVRDGDTLRVFDGRVAPGNERYGVGWLAHVEVLDRVHRDPALRAVDWLRGEQENKQRGGAVVVPAVSVQAEAAPWVRAADRAAARVRGGFLDVMRSLVPPERRHAVRGLLRR